MSEPIKEAEKNLNLAKEAIFQTDLPKEVVIQLFAPLEENLKQLNERMETILLLRQLNAPASIIELEQKQLNQACEQGKKEIEHLNKKLRKAELQQAGLIEVVIHGQTYLMSTKKNPLE